jgi:DNA repair exonuclease SbcCD ATPase subunit
VLGPGVKALIGPNNRGKSALVRALRAVFYGEARDSLVRAGAKAAVVEIGIEGGRVLRFSRQPRRNPVNLWSLHEADGTVVEENGLRHETGGRGVPGWVESLFRITRVEDLDVHIAHQKFPVFLLGEPSSRRSAVLSIGQEAAYVRDMLVIHRERCARDAALVRAGEREIAGITESLKAFESLDGLAARLDQARDLAAAAEADEARRQRLCARIGALGEKSRALAAARARHGTLQDLPPPNALSDLRSSIERSGDRVRVAQRVLSLGREQERLAERLSLLARLPAALPALDATQAAMTARTRLATLRRATEEVGARAGQLHAEAAARLAAIESLVAAEGGLCPTCGSQITAADLVRGRGHQHAEKAA